MVARDGKTIFHFSVLHENSESLFFVLDILKKGHASLTIDNFLMILRASRIEPVPLNVSTGATQSFNPGCNSSKSGSLN